MKYLTRLHRTVVYDDVGHSAPMFIGTWIIVKYFTRLNHTVVYDDAGHSAPMFIGTWIVVKYLTRLQRFCCNIRIPDTQNGGMELRVGSDIKPTCVWERWN